jgi:hypothetical protein
MAAKKTKEETNTKDKAAETAKEEPKTEVVKPAQAPKDEQKNDKAAAATAPKKGKSKKWIFAIIVIVLVLVIGGGAGAYFGYVKPNQPKNVVKTALSNVLANDQRRSFEITAEINSTDSDTQLEFDNLSISGGMDQDSNIRADIDVEASGFNVSASAIVRFDDQEAYLKLDGLDSLFSSFLGSVADPSITDFINTLSDNWIRLSVSDFEDAGFITSSQANNATECIDAISTFIESSGSDLQRQFDSLYDQANFASMKKVGADIIDGKKMTKYAVNIDEARLKAFGSQLGNVLVGSSQELVDKCGLVTSDSSSDESSSSTSNMNLQDTYLWIDSDKQVGQVQVTIKDDTMEVVLTGKLGNESVDTSQPDDFVTVPELLQDPTFSQMLGGLLGGSTTSTDDSSFEDYNLNDYENYLDYGL